MAYYRRKNYRRRGASRVRTARRYRRRNIYKSTNSASGIFGWSKKMNHSFYTTTALTNVGFIAGQWQDTVFRANSLFDPYVAVGGGSVEDFATMAGIFNIYQVMSSKIWVRPLETSATSGGTASNVGCIIIVSTDSTAITAFSKTTVLKYANRSALFTWVLDIGDQANHNASASWSLRKWNRRSYMNADHSAAAFSDADPTAQWYFHVLTGPSADDTIASKFSIDVKIQYNAIWSDPEQDA